MAGTKVCRTCKEEKSTDDFGAYKNRGTFHPDCKKCFNKKAREKNAVAPEKPLPKTKVCNGCKKRLPIARFGSKGVGRVHTRCRKCCAQSEQEYQSRNKARSPEEIPTPKEKKCSACKKVLPASKFGPKLGNKDGLHYLCRECDAKKTKAWVNEKPERIEKRKKDSKKWRTENPERHKANQRAWMEKNWAKVLEFTNANTRKYRKLFPERYIASRKKLTESGKGAAYKRKRDAQKRNALPPWLNEEDLYPLYELAKDFSKETGEIWEVDHIDPLQSDLVCGLHVFENLEVIRREDNRIKGNKFTPYRIDSDNNHYELRGDKWEPITDWIDLIS